MHNLIRDAPQQRVEPNRHHGPSRHQRFHGMGPTESGKPREIPVGRDEFAALLDCQCGEFGVGNELARRFGANAEIEMAFPGRHDEGIRLTRQRPNELNGLVERRRHGEYASVRHDAEESAASAR